MIAIKDMEMPKECYRCPLLDREYGTCNIIGETKVDMTKERASNCPLVEIQETDAEIRNELEEKVEIQEQLIEKQNILIETQEESIEIQRKIIDKQQLIIEKLKELCNEEL